MFTLKPMLNQVLNIGWTILGLSPVYYFWWVHGISWPFYVLLLISCMAFILPEKLYSKLKISKDLRVYKRLGVKFVRRFAQDGDFEPSKGIRGYLSKIRMFERYHFCCLLFFQASSVYACYFEEYLLAFLIFFCNIIYNVFPMLLQQYNSIRITRILKQHGLQV
mgnify:CR=1 FL=1